MKMEISQMQACFILPIGLYVTKYSSFPLSINFCFVFYAYMISCHIGNWTLTIMKKIMPKKKVVSKVVDFPDFDIILATECPIEIKFSSGFCKKGLQHRPIPIKGI